MDSATDTLKNVERTSKTSDSKSAVKKSKDFDGMSYDDILNYFDGSSSDETLIDSDGDSSDETVKDFHAKSSDETLKNLHAKSSDETLKDYKDKDANKASKDSKLENANETSINSDDDIDNESYDNLQVLEEDLRICGYELYNFFMARCFFSKKHPLLIRVTEDSKFTEEFGKAVIVAWHKVGTKYIEMIHDDHPRYLFRTDNFKTYVLSKVTEIVKETESRMEYQIITITAFLFDIYFCCVTIIDNQFKFLPNFADYWSELVLTIYEEFMMDGGWHGIKKICKTMSQEYNEEKVEKTLNNIIWVKITYFMKIAIPDSTYSDPKLVSRFHILSKTLQRVLPFNHPAEFRSREETLDVIFSLNTQDEMHNVFFLSDNFLEFFETPYKLRKFDKELQIKSNSRNQRRNKKKKEGKLK